MIARLARWCVALALALAAPAALAVVDESQLLPVDSAFALDARADGADTIAVRWKIADGYYLYRHRISVQAAADGVSFSPIALPEGARHHDEYFGDVQTYRNAVTGTLRHVVAPSGRATLRIKYQGCADAGVCYPPQMRVVTVALASPRGNEGDDGDASTAAADTGFAALGRALGGAPAAGSAAPVQGGQRQPLPPEQAFGFDAIARDGNTLLLRFTPARGYYLYRDKTTLRVDGDAVRLGAPRWPRGVLHRDEHFGEVVVYFGEVDPAVPLARTTTAPTTLSLSATFQGCQDGGLCYPPMTRTVRIALPAGTARPAAPKIDTTAPAAAAPAAATAATPAIATPSANDDATGISAPADVEATAGAPAVASTNGTQATVPPADAAQAEDSRLAALLAGSHRWWGLLVFFASGLALAFTPCVLPMVPILSGLIAGGGVRIGTARAFWLSLVYVLASAVVFTAAGVIAGLLGANLQAAMQRPWVLVLFALLFVALSLSMFGLYELQLPASLRARLGAASDKQRGGSLAGVAAMGALSALIVGPCVAPPLAAAVLYIAQARDPVFGGLALFVLALGMGAPLVAFGVAAGRGMPTSGPWMVTIQRIFGFVFAGLAIWMLSRILPGALVLALFGLLALAFAAWLLTQRAQGERMRWAARFAGLVFAVLGAGELLGALAGGDDPLQPLASFGRSHADAAPAFRTIKSGADLDRELAAARTAGKPVLFDFYADWCVSCKEMERYTFATPGVRTALGDFVLLKADVTANDATDQALMRRFGLYGPPATLFFHDGAERRGLRLTGFEAAGDFVRRLDRAR